jgi:hypothetical protein
MSKLAVEADGNHAVALADNADGAGAFIGSGR